MKHAIKYAKKNANETKWSLAGIALGALVTLFIGGIGITVMGRSEGNLSSVVLAVFFGLIGNRIGVGKDCLNA